MTTYHHNLNFNVELLKNKHSLINLPNIIDGKKAYHSSVSIKEHVNTDMLDLLADLNIFPDHCELFYSTPNFFSGIHVDVKHGDFTKINWVFGGTRSLMNWYKPKDEIVRNEQNLSAVNSSYIGYKRTEVDLLFSAPLGFPSVVQVGVPHNIINPIEDRYCISLVLSSFNKNGLVYRPTMHQSLNMLSKYLVPTEGFEPPTPTFVA